MDQLKKILQLPEVEKVFKAFGENSIFLVGGCVRDTLMNKSVTDIDFATPCEPLEVIEILNKSEINYIDIGIKFGTVTAIIDDKKYEITSFRKDISTDGRHAEVEFSKEMETDAARRDFTINALYVDKDCKIYDFYNGQEDLENTILRFIGDPQARIKEDYLRIIRFFRFLASNSAQSFDDDLLAVLKTEAPNLSIVSKERLWDEFTEILKSENPITALTLMQKNSIFENISEGLQVEESFENLISIESKIKDADSILRLSLLFDNNPKKIEDFVNSFPLSSNESKALLQLGEMNEKIVSYLSMKEVRFLLYKIGVSNFKNQIILNWARDVQNKNEVNWRSLYEVAISWERPKFQLDSKDVMGMGINEGPLVGSILKEVEEWWAENDFIDDKFSLIERLKAICQAHK
tara:strand:- start:535 stop:1755 length:1221 start_codon:yes stop_codon:yes gene_type:complete